MDEAAWRPYERQLKRRIWNDPDVRRDFELVGDGDVIGPAWERAVVLLRENARDGQKGPGEAAAATMNALRDAAVHAPAAGGGAVAIAEHGEPEEPPAAAGAPPASHGAPEPGAGPQGAAALPAPMSPSDRGAGVEEPAPGGEQEPEPGPEAAREQEPEPGPEAAPEHDPEPAVEKPAGAASTAARAVAAAGPAERELGEVAPSETVPGTRTADPVVVVERRRSDLSRSAEWLVREGPGGAEGDVALALVDGVSRVPLGTARIGRGSRCVGTWSQLFGPGRPLVVRIEDAGGKVQLRGTRDAGRLAGAGPVELDCGPLGSVTCEGTPTVRRHVAAGRASGRRVVVERRLLEPEVVDATEDGRVLAEVEAGASPGELRVRIADPLLGRADRLLFLAAVLSLDHDVLHVVTG